MEKKVKGQKPHVYVTRGAVGSVPCGSIDVRQHGYEFQTGMG
jgi:hypothetical protein